MKVNIIEIPLTVTFPHLLCDFANKLKLKTIKRNIYMLINIRIYMTKLLLKVITTAKMKITSKCWDNVTDSMVNQEIVT